MWRTPSILVVVLVALGIAAPVAAQDAGVDGTHGDATSDERESAEVVAVSPGLSLFGALQISAGGEIYWPGGMGFGFDLGVLAPEGNLGSGVLVFSPSMLYRFQEVGRLRPYLRGGGTVVVAGGFFPFGHVGGGANVRLSDRIGLQLEARDNFPLYSFYYLEAHSPEVRVGLVIWQR